MTLDLDPTLERARIDALLTQLRRGQLDRRQFLARAAALGLSAGMAATLARGRARKRRVRRRVRRPARSPAPPRRATR